MGLDIKQYVFRKGAANKIPVSGTFELTSRCNFCCRMCYIQMTAEEQQAFGRELTTQEWLDLARQAVDKGMIYLLLTGGEPLLRPDFVELYTALIRMGLVISVNTNGSLITPEVVQCFRQHPPEAVNITLYGASPCRYASVCGNEAGYEKAFRGIRMLKEAGVRVTLNTTFIRDNKPDMEALVSYAKTENIPIRTAAFLFPPVRNGKPEQDIVMSAEEMGQFAAEFDCITMEKKQKKARMEYILKCLEEGKAVEQNAPESKAAGCMAGRGAFWISWNGMMYSCGMLSHEGYSVLEHDFSEAWKRTMESAKKLRLPEECSVCKYQRLCPSCAAISQCVHNEQGKLVPYMCRRTEAYVEAFLDMVQKETDYDKTAE